jgi:hypothetical protein
MGMERLYSQDSIRSKDHLDFQKKKFYKGVPWEICYSIESIEILKAIKYSSNRNPNSRCEKYDVLNP